MPSRVVYQLDGLARLLRTRWTDPQMLAEEIFLLLGMGFAGPNLGPVQIDLGNGSTPATVRGDNLRDPSGSFRLPNLNFPELDFPSYGSPSRDNMGHQVNPNQITINEYIQNPPAGPEGRSQSTQRVRQQVEVDRRWMTVPGKVVSGSGNTYVMRLYPYGPDDTTNSFNATVTQLQIDPNEIIPVDTWTMVTRFLELQITTTSTLTSVPGTQADVEISRRVDIQITKTRHWMQVPVWI